MEDFVGCGGMGLVFRWIFGVGDEVGTSGIVRLRKSSILVEAEKSSGFISLSIFLNGVTGLNSGGAGAGLRAGFVWTGG